MVKQAQFVMVPRELFTDQQVSAHAIAVYGALATYANRDRSAYPSHKSIAKRSRCSESTVKRALCDLQHAGWVTITSRHSSNGDQTSNDYTLALTPQVTEDRPQATQDRPARSHRTDPQVAQTYELEPFNLDPYDLEDTRKLITEAFISKAPDPKHFDFRREGTAISKCVMRAQEEGADAADWARRFLNTAYSLVRSGAGVWKGQPFLPTIVMAGGLYPRIIDAMRASEEERLDESMLELIAATDFEGNRPR